jgi:glycosyltransferase involved in cell wall biosynthesis
MAAGVPVIASNAGGPSEIISHGVDGLLVDPGDVRALSDAMLTLAGDVDLRRRLAAAATTRARDFSPEKSAATVTELYSHILRSEE